MASVDKTELIGSAIQFIYDEHVNVLISILNTHAKQIRPNDKKPLIDILNNYNSSIGKEINRYGEELRETIKKIVGMIYKNGFNEADKESINQYINKYCCESLYITRFDILVESIERNLLSQGVVLNREKQRIGIPRSLCEVGSINGIQTVKNKLSNDMDLLILSQTKRREEIFKFQPSFMGIGVNLMPIIKRWFRKT